jgi:hypothetical protein
VHLCTLIGIKNHINPSGEVVSYGDPARSPKRKYINWNTSDYISKAGSSEVENDDDDGFV